MNVFELFATIGLKDADFNKGIDAASEKGQSFGAKFGKVAAGVGKAAVGMAAAATGIATAMVGVATSSAAAGDRIDKMSQKLGLTREGFQEWDYILSQNGASIDSFGVGMKTLQNNMDALGQGSEQVKTKFARLGISFEDLADKSPEQAMGLVVQRLQDMPEGAEKTALALDMFGKQGMELMPMLNQTAESTEELRKRAHELGMVLGDDIVDSGVAFTDALDSAKRTVAGLKNTLGAELLPSLTTGLEAFMGFVTGAEGAEEKMQSAFDGIIGAVTNKMPQFVEKGATIVISLVQGIAKAAPDLVQGIAQVVPTIITAIIATLPLLLQAGIDILLAITMGIVDSLPALIPVAVSAILKLVEVFIDNVDLLVDAAIAIIFAVAEGLIDALPILIEKAPEIITKLVLALIENVPKIMKAAQELVRTLAAGLIEALPLLWEAVKNLGEQLYNKFLDFESIAVEAGKNLISGIWEGIKSMGAWIADKVGGFFKENVIDKVTGLFQQHSPSKLFAKISENNIVGYVKDTLDRAGQVKDAVVTAFGGVGDAAAAAAAIPAGGVAGAMVTQAAPLPVGGSDSAGGADSASVLATILQGFSMVSDTILEAMPEKLDFNIDSRKFAEAVFNTFMEVVNRRGRMWPTEGDIKGIAMSVKY